jgi:hypothetical protein
MSVNDKMYIPNILKIGYRNRKDTYTGKLAYVIYFDEKGKLRKEKSWEQWRDKKIDSQEIPNDPIEGFVLNKDVGGVHSGWHSWDTRIEKVRVYDPRDFEFEISIPNLLFILQETSAIKGKGLEGEFVYAWSGTELVLLPVESEIYKACNIHTERQAVKMQKEDVKEGYSYIMKDGEPVMYLGRYPYNNKNWRFEFNPVGKMHIFLRLTHEDDRKYGQKDPYIAESGFIKVAECTSPSSLDAYPDELDNFKSSIWYGELKEVKVTKVTFQETDLREKILLIKEGEKYYPFAFRELYDYSYGYRKKKFEIKKGTKPFTPKLKDGTIKVPSISIPYRRNGSHYDEKKPEHLTEDQMKNLNLYKIQVVTTTDKTITVG